MSLRSKVGSVAAARWMPGALHDALLAAAALQASLPCGPPPDGPHLLAVAGHHAVADLAGGSRGLGWRGHRMSQL